MIRCFLSTLFQDDAVFGRARVTALSRRVRDSISGSPNLANAFSGFVAIAVIHLYRMTQGAVARPLKNGTATSWV